MRLIPISFPRLLLLAVLLLAGSTAGASDPVGTWTMDTAALRDGFRRLMEADAAGMPPEHRAQMEAVLPGRSTRWCAAPPGRLISSPTARC